MEPKFRKIYRGLLIQSKLKGDLGENCRCIFINTIIDPIGLTSGTHLILLSLAMLDIGQGDLEGIILPHLEDFQSPTQETFEGTLKRYLEMDDATIEIGHPPVPSLEMQVPLGFKRNVVKP